MQTINDRIAILIDTLDMNKTSFAKSLNVSQQYISKLVRTGTPSDLLIEDICEKHRVNEDWLRNGTGGNDNMFVQPVENELISRAARILGERDPLFEAFVETYSQLNAANRKVLLDFFADFSDTLTKKKE